MVLKQIELILKKGPLPHWKWGYADFFDNREKRAILNLAEAKPRDILYDLGCGDASFLIFAVEQFGIQRAVGYEDMRQRVSAARKKIKEHGLERKIEIIGKDLHKEADLSQADNILDMLPQGLDDVAKLYTNNLKEGTRIIKHDLPLIGFIPQRIDHPFCLHTIPLKATESAQLWASKVLGQKGVTLDDVWHELFYYGNQKGYSKWDINDYKKLAAIRFRDA